ncbi:MAG: phasin family protein [Hyphomicrobium sp.]
MSSQMPFGGFNPSAFTAPFQMYFSNLDTMAQSMGPMKGLARIQLETMGLLNRRGQALMEIPSRLSRCRTPQDLVAEQTRFWQTAFQQYNESSRRIMEAWAQVMPMSAAHSRDAAVERDYISFADPKEANGHARSARDRHAA